MKRLLPIPLVFLFAFSALGQGIQWFKGSLEAAQEKAKKDEKLVLIYFYSPM